MRKKRRPLTGTVDLSWPVSCSSTTEDRWNAVNIEFICATCGKMRVIQSITAAPSGNCPRCERESVRVEVLGRVATRRTLPIRERLNTRYDYARHSRPRLLVKW